MKTKLLLSLVLMMSSSLFAEDYRVNDDFKLDNSLNFHGDANFYSPFAQVCKTFICL